MKKIIIFIVIGGFLMLAAPMVAGAKSFNDLTPYQKQKYWVYIKECNPLLLKQTTGT